MKHLIKKRIEETFCTRNINGVNEPKKKAISQSKSLKADVIFLQKTLKKNGHGHKKKISGVDG